MFAGKSLSHNPVSVLPLEFVVALGGPKLVSVCGANRAVTLGDFAQTYCQVLTPQQLESSLVEQPLIVPRPGKEEIPDDRPCLNLFIRNWTGHHLISEKQATTWGEHACPLSKDARAVREVHQCVEANNGIERAVRKRQGLTSIDVFEPNLFAQSMMLDEGPGICHRLGVVVDAHSRAPSTASQS